VAIARIPADELQRLKTEIAIERLAASRGVKLSPKGNDLVGLCPFHDDKTPSLVVTPSKNLWHCFGCSAGGDVIAWVMKSEGVNFRHAVELLREGAVLGEHASGPTRKRKLATPVSIDATGDALMHQVVAYYHRCLLDEPTALEYVVKTRGISRAAVEHFKLGFCNRTLGLRIPPNDRVEGALIRLKLRELGVVRETGHEHMRGRVVVPLLDDTGAVVGLYGRTIADTGMRPGTPRHLYLPGPHRGVFNAAGLRGARTVILCEALLDALTFWSAGFVHVTTSYGVEGLTDEVFAAVTAPHVERVLVAYDRDDAGDAAAAKVIERLRACGKGCARVQFPRGMDANSYALKVQPAAKSLKLVLDRAVFEDHGRPVVVTTEQPEHIEELQPAAKEESPKPEVPPAPSPAPPPAPAAAAFSLAAEPAPRVDAGSSDRDEHIITIGDRRYRARGVAKNLSHEVLRVNLFVSRAEVFYVDTLDLYSARQRAVFIKHAALDLGCDDETIRRDLGRLLLALEEKNDAAIAGTLEKKTEAPMMSDEERKEALSLLQDPQLLARILQDFEACGVVGERVNKLVGLLGAVSRKLDEPLAVIIQSSSAAGKSSLMEAVLAFVPAEERVKYSAMTGQSLFYMGESDLKHKVLAIVEEEGAERASYALKLLQSEKELTIASTGKDPETGKLVTHEYRVEGPVMIFLTTTAIEIDEELLNRCLVLSVDEDRAQTRKIHELQRKRQTLEGLLLKEERSAILRRHQNAQRLLRPLFVANPFAEQLTFLDDKTRTRRDHMKYLTLIRTIALLHQHQRTVKTIEHKGRVLEVIEATADDVLLANRLCCEVLGRSLDELPPQTRRLLLALEDMVAAACEQLDCKRSEYRFTRREILDRTGWSYDQVRVHLERLVALEHVLVHTGGRGHSFVYELLWDGAGKDGAPFFAGLVDAHALGATMTAHLGGLFEEIGPPLGPLRASIGGPVGPPLSSDKPSDVAELSRAALAASSREQFRARTRGPYRSGAGRSGAGAAE
jgi:DNA primase